MGKALVIVVGVAIFVYALFDLIATPARNTRFIPKPLWFLALLIVPLGPLLWIFFGQKPSPPGPSAPPQRRRPTAMGPDDDPDYLRGL
jgi:hypothetical protein